MTVGPDEIDPTEIAIDASVSPSTRVRREAAELLSGRDHRRDAALAQKVDATIGDDGRRIYVFFR
jgi:hypothetical protein